MSHACSHPTAGARKHTRTLQNRFTNPLMLMKFGELSFSLRRMLGCVSAWLPTLVSLACVALLFGPLLTLAQNDKQVWVQRFGTTFGSSELAHSIARDSAGNAVVAGDTDEGGLGSGILVIKYSP